MKTTNKFKQNISANSVIVHIFISAVLGIAGCQQEGTAEKTGEKIDRAVEKAEQKIEHATERAEEKIEGTEESAIDKSQTAGEYIDDSVITLKVKTAILKDPKLNASHIEVTTVNGVVNLSGTVSSEQNIGRAMETAHSQKNVKSVQNVLVVEEAAPTL